MNREPGRFLWGRALTRGATEVNETDLLSFALDASASQCEDYCRRLRNGDPVASEADARRLHEARSLVRYLRGQGYEADALPTRFGGEQEEQGEKEAAAEALRHAVALDPSLEERQ